MLETDGETKIVLASESQVVLSKQLPLTAVEIPEQDRVSTL